MSFTKGMKRPPNAGRVKGKSFNKRTIGILEAVDKICAKENANPFEIMAKIAADETEDTSLRLQAAKELAQYLQPKKRAIEHSGKIDLPGSLEHPLVLEIRQSFLNELKKGK